MPSLITANDNLMLIAVLYASEIKAAIFSLDQSRHFLLEILGSTWHRAYFLCPGFFGIISLCLILIQISLP